jgi:hypothetical protein
MLYLEVHISVGLCHSYYLKDIVLYKHQYFSSSTVVFPPNVKHENGGDKQKA